MSNLAKDWKDELTEGELQALQYEVSLNGVKEEIRHVLDSEMAKRDGHLTPQQMYEAIKKYKTHVARSKRLDGKGTSTSARQQKRLPASPQGTSLDFTRQQHLLPPLVDRMMRLITLKVPCRVRAVTPRRLNLLTRKMRGCTSPVTSSRLYRMILSCRSKWPMPCESKR